MMKAGWLWKRCGLVFVQLLTDGGLTGDRDAAETLSTLVHTASTRRSTQKEVLSNWENTGL